VNLVLGVSGSVAAYRSADLARELMRAGFVVRVCLTDAAEKFVTQALFEALTGQPCLTSAFDEPVAGRMAHIDWARSADVILVAPATANTLNKLAAGIADDMLTTLVLASEAPLVIAPAMNPHMYGSEVTRNSLDELRARAASIVEPLEGDVACGEQGQGKLASISAIVDAVREITARSAKLAGKTVLITSGPTREPLDSVRFLSNRSSGKMGSALARAVMLMGGQATLVCGPGSARPPLGAQVVRVETALDMLEAARGLAQRADLIVGAAAVADYRPEQSAHGKIRRSSEPIELRLVPNPDVIAELGKVAKPGVRIVGFAAEPDSALDAARQKIVRKGLFAIAVNNVSRPDAGFDVDSNELSLLFADGRTARSGLQSKLSCALWLLEQIVDSP
jgi:phosphopantothenoylcysteine decarboxylase/phosphopantothenate--cysteine ligase